MSSRNCMIEKKYAWQRVVRSIHRLQLASNAHIMAPIVPGWEERTLIFVKTVMKITGNQLDCVREGING